MAKYEIKKKYLIIYLCLIVVGGMLMLCRWLNHIGSDIKLLPDFLLAHITNFALCMMLLLVFGFVVLIVGGKIKIITITALLLAILSVVYECFIPILNTPDIWDAIFSVVGIAVAFLYLVMLKKHGLVAQRSDPSVDE